MTIDRKTAGRLREQLHDINNELNTILMQSELLRLLTDGTQNAEDARAALDAIANACRTAGLLAGCASDVVRNSASRAGP